MGSLRQHFWPVGRHFLVDRPISCIQDRISGTFFLVGRSFFISDRVQLRLPSPFLLVCSGGRSTQPLDLSQSIDTPGQVLLHYKWKFFSSIFTWAYRNHYHCRVSRFRFANKMERMRFTLKADVLLALVSQSWMTYFRFYIKPSWERVLWLVFLSWGTRRAARCILEKKKMDSKAA